MVVGCGVDWAATAGMLQAGLAAAAGVIAIWAGRGAWKVARIEEGRDLERQADREQEQASRVWAIHTSSGTEFRLHNGSDQPIYKCTAILEYEGKRTYSSSGSGVIAPGESCTGRLMDSEAEKLGVTVHRGADGTTWQQVQGTAGDPFRVGMYFNDASNRRWVREPDGSLARVEADYRLWGRDPNWGRELGSQGESGV